MSDERPIEKLLRRYAKKRREDAGAPLEMHPATRRLLRGEVARQYGKAGGEKASSSGWLAALWRRWIYATAAVSAVVVAAILVLNNSQPGVHELAKQNATAAKLPADQPAEELAKNFGQTAPVASKAAADSREAELPVTTPALAPLERQESPDDYKRTESRLTATAAGTASRRTDVASAPAPVADGLALADKETQPAPAPLIAGEQLSAGNRLLAEPSAAAAPAASPSAPGRSAPATVQTRTTTADSLAGAKAGKDSSEVARVASAPPSASAPAARFGQSYAPVARGGGVERDRQTGSSQLFANAPAKSEAEGAVPTAPAAPVLLNFQVVQAGNQWQVIDADGSTYLGDAATEPASLDADAVKGATALKPQAKVPSGGATEEAALNRFYRVAGTNRTLNQQVVFRWNFLAPTNQVVQPPSPAAGGLLNHQSLNRTQQLPGLHNNSGILGRAQINSGKEIEIRAAPVNP